MPETDAKKHHWVPRCYLRNFIVSPKIESVYMYQNNKETINVGIDNVAAQNNLYTFTDKTTGEKTKRVETMFGIIEGAASPVLEKIIRQQNLNLTANEKGALVQFTAFLITRGPSFSDWLKNMTAEHHKWEMKFLAEHPDTMRERFNEAGIPFDNEEEFEKTRQALLDFDKHIKIEMKGGEGGLFKQAAEMAMDFAEMFSIGKSWHLLIVDCDRVFVTSDNPVVVQKTRNVHPHMASGYGYGTIFLTISPKICFVMRNQALLQEVIKVGRKEVDYINQSIIKNTHRQVYSNLKSRDIKRMRDKFLPGEASKVISTRIRSTPYVVTEGVERDFELPILERYTIKN